MNVHVPRSGVTVDHSSAERWAPRRRFFFMREVVFGQDGDFAEERFRDTVNAALANDIGNLCNRCLGLLKKNCDSTFPVAAAAVPAEHPLRAAAAAAVPAAAAAYEDLAFHDAIAAALSISGRCGTWRTQSSHRAGLILLFRKTRCLQEA